MKMCLAAVLVTLLAPGAFAARCPREVQQRSVRGGSLEGLASAGQKLNVLVGFYDCHEPKKDELVAYSYAGDPAPLFKVIKAVPGDAFHLDKAPEGWRLLINGQAAVNSEAKPYLLGEQSFRLLSLYESGYSGVIPPRAYLIMGNLPESSLESGRYALVDIGDILGKATAEEKRPAKPAAGKGASQSVALPSPHPAKAAPSGS
jgi:hypothetical protein